MLTQCAVRIPEKGPAYSSKGLFTRCISDSVKMHSPLRFRIKKTNEVVASCELNVSMKGVFFFLNVSEFPVKSAKHKNHQSMNWNQFKDPVYCLLGTVVASWSLHRRRQGCARFLEFCKILVSARFCGVCARQFFLL